MALKAARVHRAATDPDWVARQLATKRKSNQAYKEKQRAIKPPAVRKARPRCESCPPTGRLCKACTSAYQSARRAERLATDPVYAAREEARLATIRAAWAERQARKGKAPRAPRVPVPRKRAPRCEVCELSPRQCAECKKASQVISKRKQAALRPPSVPRKVSAPVRLARVMAAAPITPTARLVPAHERNADVKTCPTCMTRGRWDGVGCRRHRGIETPAGLNFFKARSYTAEARAAGECK